MVAPVSVSPATGCFQSQAGVPWGPGRPSQAQSLICLYRTVTPALVKEPGRRACLLWLPEQGGRGSALPADRGSPGSAPGCWEGGRSRDKVTTTCIPSWTPCYFFPARCLISAAHPTHLGSPALGEMPAWVSDGILENMAGPAKLAS